MIKDLLIDIQTALTYVANNLPSTSPFRAKKIIEGLIEHDLERLALNDPAFLAGPQGYTDYYSPYAEQQLNNKKEILEKYLDKLYLLQATLYCIYHNDAKHLLDKNFKVLAENPEVKESLEKIKAINNARKQLIDTENALKKDLTAKAMDKLSASNRIELEQKRDALKLQIQQFSETTNEIPGFANIQARIMTLHRRLNTHEHITKQIPKGMMDIKRALSFAQHHHYFTAQIKEKTEELAQLESGDPKIEQLNRLIVELNKRKAALPELRFTNSGTSDELLKSMLKDLRKLMKTSIDGYQDLAIAGGDLNAYLHQTTGFYWENLLLFRRTVESINQQLQQAKDLTPQGQDLAQCISNGLKHIPSEQSIQKALQEVRKVDSNLRLKDSAYLTKVDNHNTAVRFYKMAATNLLDKIMAKNAGPNFFFPYNSANYVLDHPPHTDISGALGNCFGETQMFLKQINSKTPTLNNICPQPDLINFQLDQTRKASTKLAKDLGSYTADPTKGEFAKWSTIKDLVTQEVDSQKHGDVCWLRFSGARVPGHDKDVSHAMGFIKMKNPSPYKYIIYDYNFGAMGFSDDLQLQTFFENIFEGPVAYYPYTKCSLEKLDEVRDECQLFFNGPDGVKPLQAPNPNAVCTRQYWNEERLLHFIKYLDGKKQSDISLIIEQAQRLPAEAKNRVYLALLQKDNIQKSINRIPLDVDIEMLKELVASGVVSLREARQAFPKHEAFQVDKPIINSGSEAKNISECQDLIAQLRTMQVSSEDHLLRNYCDEQSFKLSQYKADPEKLAEIKKSLTKYLRAVNSAEMIAIKKEIERLHSMKQSFFGFGPVDSTVINKINSIKAALINVPLLERIHAFSNEQNEQCNQVRIALAEHRHWFRNSALTDGKVDPTKTAARSFDNLKKQFAAPLNDPEQDERAEDSPNI
ncbi:hypothetical protein [Legionella sp. km772]|uniref:hypothetical protein n=1 Tax=Legionella sp. km772 TaxID=2498111 RepID=UPI000F8C58B3|nr:hypothetical protein [Legionella sp. km772]RUR09286.1 hypothetical protein ELY15_09475 [Legionella sp. km772]